MEKNHLRSKLRVAQGLGSAHSGVHHWWTLRITAVALIPLSLWFICSLMQAMLLPSAMDVRNWLSSPLTAILLSLMIVAGFWHMCLGNREVIEDYVKCHVMKFSLLMLNAFACFTLAAVGLLAVIKIHLLDLAAAAL